MLEGTIGSVRIDPALEKPLDGLKPKAPGMKYTHYAPKGELTLVENAEILTTDNIDMSVVNKIKELTREKKDEGYRVGIMAASESVEQYENVADVLICVGKRHEQGTVASGLYAALREFDEAKVDYIYAESFRGDGLSYAIMNRLLKAAGHRVIKV